MKNKDIPEMVSGLVKHMGAFSSLSANAAKEITENPQAAIVKFIAANDPILVSRPKEDFILDATEGGKFSLSELEVFSSFNCIGCTVSDLEVASSPSLKTTAKHHELVKDANSFQILAFFSRRVDLINCFLPATSFWRCAGN